MSAAAAAVVLLLAVSVSPHKNATVTLEWTANPPEQQVTLYKIYELVGSNQNPRGQTDSNAFVIPNEKAGPHTYVVTAFNGLESPPSNAVSVKI